jgi:hypothetical protein
MSQAEAEQRWGVEKLGAQTSPSPMPHSRTRTDWPWTGGHELTFQTWSEWEWQNISALVIALSFTVYLFKMQDDRRDWYYLAWARRWVMWLMALSWWLELVFRFWCPITKRWKEEEDAAKIELR